MKQKGFNGTKSLYGFYLIVPAVLIYTLFRMFPAIAGLFFSFFDLRTFDLTSLSFAGLRNYTSILTDPYVNVAIKNTLVFAVITTIGKTVFGLILALFVNRKFFGMKYMRTVFYLPAVLNNVAVGLVFRSMMHPNGLINQVLEAIGLGVLAQNWLTDPNTAIFSCAFVEIWKWTGFSMIIFLAGLQSIDKTYYESAEIDGATWWDKFKSVTIPLIMPTLKNALVVNISGGLKVFDIVQTLTKGGPGSATTVFGTLSYSYFGKGNYGAGSAASVILTLFVLLIALPTNQYLTKKEVEM